MKRAAVAAAGLAVCLAIAFVWLFGSGAVFGDEAGTWPTVRAIVQTRVLGHDLVRLTREPEKWVATGAGIHLYYDMMERRGWRLVDRAGGGLFFRGRSGRRCNGSVYQFTANLAVFHVPDCAAGDSAHTTRTRPPGPIARTRRALVTRRICRNFAKPSDGLEPSTPSLPWRCSTN